MKASRIGVFLVLAGVVAAVGLSRHSLEVPRDTEVPACASRMQQAPFNGVGADGVALQFIRLEQFPEQVLAGTGCWRLVNFWATWCEPCREEMPALARFADRFREQGLEVMTVNLEPPQTGEAAHRFLREHRVNAINVRLDIPDTHAIAEWLDGRWMGGIPFTAIVGPDGEWHFSQHGLFDAEAVEQALQHYLAAEGAET